MKVRLLKKIRDIGRNQVSIYSVTKNGGYSVGMKIGYNDHEYAGLFCLGDSENDVKNKACNIYLKNNIKSIRIKYKKYSILNK